MAPPPRLVDEIEQFVLAHRACGSLTGDAGALTSAGYRLWVACSCGARLERWVDPDTAAADLAFSALLTLPN